MTARPATAPACTWCGSTTDDLRQDASGSWWCVSGGEDGDCKEDPDDDAGHAISAAEFRARVEDGRADYEYDRDRDDKLTGDGKYAPDDCDYPEDDVNERAR